MELTIMLLTQSVNVHHSVQMQTLNSHQTGHTFNLPPDRLPVRGKSAAATCGYQ